MLNSKQRAHLKYLATKEDSIMQIGKSGCTEKSTENLTMAFQTRELVKVTVLNSCAESKTLVAEKLSERTHSEIVQIIGNKIIFYKKHKKSKIKWPSVSKDMLK